MFVNLSRRRDGDVGEPRRDHNGTGTVGQHPCNGRLSRVMTTSSPAVASATMPSSPSAAACKVISRLGPISMSASRTAIINSTDRGAVVQGGDRPSCRTEVRDEQDTSRSTIARMVLLHAREPVVRPTPEEEIDHAERDDLSLLWAGSLEESGTEPRRSSARGLPTRRTSRQGDERENSRDARRRHVAHGRHRREGLADHKSGGAIEAPSPRNLTPRTSNRKPRREPPARAPALSQCRAGAAAKGGSLWPRG